MGNNLSCNVPIEDCECKHVYDCVIPFNPSPQNISINDDPRVLLATVTDYKNIDTLLDESWKISPLDTLRIIFFTRDVVDGRGDRFIFGEMCNWLLKNHRDDLERVYSQIPKYGTWKDLFTIFAGTDFENEIVKYYAEKIKESVEFLNKGETHKINYGIAKYAPTEGCSLDRKYKLVSKIVKLLNITKEDYRKNYIRPLRRLNVCVEEYMCSGRWSEIDYSKLNSSSFKKYKKSFIKHDPERLMEYMNSCTKKYTNNVSSSVNTLDILDIINRYVDCRVPNNIFKSIALEKEWYDFISCQNFRCDDDMICVLDTSQSMFCKMVNSKYSSIDMALSIGIFSSTMKSSDNSPFYKKWINFSLNPELKEFEGDELYEIIKNIQYGENYYKSSKIDIKSILKLVLDNLKKYNTNCNFSPKYILIITNTNFDLCTIPIKNKLWDDIKNEYNTLGYTPPNLIFWNTASHPSKIPVVRKNLFSDGGECILLDGYNPKIYSKIIKGDLSNLSPYFFMRDIIDSERYSTINFLTKKNSTIS